MHRSLNIASLQWGLAATTLASAMLLGGGQGTLGDTLVQLMALALLLLAAWRHATDPSARLPRMAWLALVPLLLPLAQLLPLPDSAWTWTPARRDLAGELAAAGVSPGARLGLIPVAVERSLAWLLPAVALFIAGLQTGMRGRVGLVVLFVVVACVGATLGLAQIADGPESALRFYEITNIHGAVGFFANRNHHASFLAMALPFAVVGTAWWLRQRRDQDAGEWLWAVAGLGLVGVLMLGIAIANSRAGLLLGAVGFMIAVAAALAVRRPRGLQGGLVLAAAVVVLLASQFALLAVVRSVGTEPNDDVRSRFTSLTLAAAKEHAPLGSGLGGFVPAFETVDQGGSGRIFVNHAHNDAAELWLEGGWLAAALGLPLLGAFAWAGWRVWISDRAIGGAGLRLLRQAAWIALLLVLLHSLVDYPLRTSAHLALFGLLAALLSRPLSEEFKPAP
jgi:hypothetical protein